jgi:exosortase
LLWSQAPAKAGMFRVEAATVRMWRRTAPTRTPRDSRLYLKGLSLLTANEKLHLTAFSVVMIAIAAVYWQVLAALGYAWYTDDNYSHGFFIAPLAAYFAWERRAEFTAKPIKPSAFGIVVVAASLVLLVGGILGAELFLSRVSFLGVLTGTILFLYGWQRLRVLMFPLAFMLLMIPIPAIIFNQIAFPLQLLASNVGEYTITSLDIPILREGNVLILANAQLEVAEACSGIRSLVSLFTLGLVFGYFVDKRAWVRVVIALSSVPVAILANGLRVASAGIAAHNFGSAGAEGLFHEFSGWVVFVLAFLMMFGLQRLLQRFLPDSLPPRVSNPDTISI